jgi:hypothetical protein
MRWMSSIASADVWYGAQEMFDVEMKLGKALGAGACGAERNVGRASGCRVGRDFFPSPMAPGFRALACEYDACQTEALFKMKA